MEHSILDYEDVVRVLPESFRNSYKDNPDVLIYLSELGSFGLQRLSQEPDRLAEEKNSVLEQTQDLAFHNYKTFIQAAECSQTISQDFNVIELRLNTLSEKLPSFKDKCSEFGKEALKINARWRQASSTLNKYPQLLEFLEMSQLMDNYVRNGYFDEALELSAYVKRLEKKHSDIPLIKSIVKNVQVLTNIMLSQLLTKLRTNIQLPECLKIVGCLRRMNVFNESELRIKFLQGRDAWFLKVINDIDKTDKYEHIIKVIESSRVHLFDITTQYRAIFSDDDPLMLVKEDSKANCAIFHSWIIWKISWFLNILEQDISANLGGRVDSVLAQCMYFGLSFSRVNIDFRPLLAPIFEKISLNKFNSTVDRATIKFARIMETYAFSSYTSSAILATSLSEISLQPPISLLDFQPLAQFCNDILNALNELKLCCTYSISMRIVNTLQFSINQVTKSLISIHSKKKHRLNYAELEHFNLLCSLISSDLIPHFNKCLLAIFPSDNIAQVLGISTLEFKKFEHLHKLDVEKTSRELKEIMPAKEDVGLTLTVKCNVQLEDDQSNFSLDKTIHLAVDVNNKTDLRPSTDSEIEYNLESKEEPHCVVNDTADENVPENRVDASN